MSVRADYLVSFCLVNETPMSAEIDALERFAQDCGRRFQHWEILTVVGESARLELAALGPRLSALRNLRILMVGDRESLYNRRGIAAEEAIGDVVVISEIEEALAFDLADFADQARATGQIVMATGEKRRAERFLIHSPLRLLTGYKVSTRDLKTIALPRENLTRVLARPTAAIDLRFEPKHTSERYLRRVVAFRAPPQPLLSWRRLGLVADILSASGPRFLKAFALLSFVVFMIAGLYGVYAIGVWGFDDEVQPGWVTTALSLGGLTGFLSLGFALFSLVLARMMETQDRGGRDAVLDEIGNVAFFEHTRGLNIETGSSGLGS